MAAKSFLAQVICLQDGPIHGRRVHFHPGEQRGAKVEAYGRIVVEHRGDIAVAVEQAGCSVWRVTLRGDALVPIVIGIGGVLQFNRLERGVFARRLIEVAVNTYVAVHLSLLGRTRQHYEGASERRAPYRKATGKSTNKASRCKAGRRRWSASTASSVRMLAQRDGARGGSARRVSPQYVLVCCRIAGARESARYRGTTAMAHAFPLQRAKAKTLFLRAPSASTGRNRPSEKRRGCWRRKFRAFQLR